MSNYKHPGKDLENQLWYVNEPKGTIAKKLGVPQSNLSEVFAGKRKITPKLAVKLEKAYPTYFNAQIWAGMQIRFDVQEAQKTLKKKK